HLDSLQPSEVLQIIDACGVERIVNITMKTGEAALEMIRLFHRTSDRFSTIGWMDWSDVERPDFAQRSVERLERLLDPGACGTRRATFYASTTSASLRSLRRPGNSTFPSCFTPRTPMLSSSPLIATT